MKKFLTTLSISTTLVLCTALVLLYAKGYRFNMTENTFVHTGILHIETQPSRANFYLTEEFQGKSPKAVSSISEGQYKLDIWLEGYHDIEYDVEILAEKSTPMSVFLFRKTPETKVITEIQDDISFSHTDYSHNYAIIFTQTDSTELEKSYDVLKYQTNTRFWQRGNNPATLYSFTINAEDEIADIVVSPNGKNFVMNIVGEERVEDEDTKTLPQGQHIISFDTRSILATIDEDIKWSNDGETVVWMNSEGINKMNLKDPETTTLILPTQEGRTIIYYEANTNGEIYFLYEEGENDYVTLSSISTTQPETDLIETIYFQQEIRFLDDCRGQETIEYKTFTNSPQSTLFVGKPTSFSISKETQHVFFNTEFATYMYNTKEDKYILISPYRAEILSFSPDGKKITFLDLENEKLGFYIFDKETSNLSVTLGGGYLDNYINNEICTDFAWHQNSQNIYYVCENTLYATDIRKGGGLNLIQNFGEKILLENAKKITSLLKKVESYEIVEFTIN